MRASLFDFSSPKILKSAAARFLFFPQQKSSRGEEISMSGFERLDRLSLPQREAVVPKGKRNGMAAGRGK